MELWFVRVRTVSLGSELGLRGPVIRGQERSKKYGCGAIFIEEAIFGNCAERCQAWLIRLPKS